MVAGAVTETVESADAAQEEINKSMNEEDVPLSENEEIVDELQLASDLTPSDETAVITEGMTIIGDIKSGGSLDLTGNVEGNIDILGKLSVTGGVKGDSRAAEIYAENAKVTGELRSSGAVKIGQSTVVIGNVFASSAVIAGAVKGDIDVHGPVILDTSAIVMGNIKSKSVQINNGAVIEGMCSQTYADVNPTSFFEEFGSGK
ncbi:MAG: polymer-forming cytoskeletal protein [Lachnospiraceae bacterium]|nr:polymer-forming cytoskeletal protein [Lachnospiraceae bacterium]